MIIRSLRLKNIKSYGAGPNGDGITVAFQPGVNRVAGRNGHGKTTLVEALGYALFLAQPDFEESFRLPTYFLRNEEKEGEIDVVFEHAAMAYRLERGLGQTKRRTKIVQLNDGSTCEEGDEAVSAFLCRLLGFKEPRQLTDLFSNLIGVKQGRLAWPFDSKPAAAREFFEPLLDVAIFRQSEMRMREAQGRFRTLREEQDKALATMTERIEGRAASVERVPIAEARVLGLAKTLGKSRQQKEEAERRKSACEQKQAAYDAAKTARDEATARLKHAGHRRETDQQWLGEAEQAARELQRTEPGYQAFAKAEERLRILQEQQQQRSVLERQRADAQTLQAGWEAKLDGARKQSIAYAGEREARIKQAGDFRQQIADGRKLWQETEPAYVQLSDTTAAVKRSRDTVESWIETLGPIVKTNQGLLTDALSGWEPLRTWDAQAVLNAEKEERRLAQTADELGRRLAKADEATASLAAQLEQINGGVCPFLKEQCRQFDPKAVQSDLSVRRQEWVNLGRQQKEAVSLHEHARKSWESLRAQEIVLTRQKDSVGERIGRFVEQHNRLIPGAMEKHLTLLQQRSTLGSTWPQPWPQASASACWHSTESRLETDRLESWAKSERLLFTKVAQWFKQLNPILNQQFAQFETQRADRVRQERDLENLKVNLERADREAREFGSKLEQFAAEAAHAESQVKMAAARVTDSDEKLRAFADLEAQHRDQQRLKEEHGESHKRHLGAAPLAAQLDTRRAALKQSSELETQAGEQARLSIERFDLANREFDPAAIEQARNEAAAAAARLVVDENGLQVAKHDLDKEREQLKQWQEACRERDRIQDELGRLHAAGYLSKLAGRILRDAAPAVAQHLCSRIAAHAQRIFNEINQEPIELEWKADPQYSLRIVPGDRRFAMLSGGEQTKLALAMTLAMIQEFSSLSFAVFDEPTYAVDAESREKLADAILEAQKAAGLEQLIVVSHDDAFEGKIEHVVLLSKHAGSGTEIVALT